LSNNISIVILKGEGLQSH